jgi:hypothetical protein
MAIHCQICRNDAFDFSIGSYGPYLCNKLQGQLQRNFVGFLALAKRKTAHCDQLNKSRVLSKTLRQDGLSPVFTRPLYFILE